MPKRLNIHPNERVDLVDFSNASSGYTTDKSAFTLDRTFRDSFSRFLRGFEVSFNGNQITVFNGVAIDRFGEVLNSEDQANTSRTFTIPTTPNQAYFVEVFFEETDSDTDSRAFWDPTFTNPPPIPSGREFRLNVSTRVTPDWNVDFNTSGFAVVTDPNSRRIPLLQVKTGLSGAIDPGAAGFLFGTGVLSTATTFDSAATATTLRVVDATAFLIGDSVTVDALGVGAEAAVIGNIDYANAILTLSGPLTNAHLAGSVVRRTAGNTFLLQDTNPNGLAGRADVRKRMFQGDEIRGSALTVDTNAILPTDRSDLSVFSVKDEIDFLSAQIRELKFGALRSDTNQAILPSTFALAPRYYDNAGGVAGARSYSVTIGDGINSFGDFNGLDELPFLAAVAFLQTLPTPGGTVFVKRGTYLFTSTVTVDINVSFIGEGRKLTILSNQSATDPLFELANTGLVARDVTFNSLEMTRINTATPTGVLVSGVAVRPYFQDCNLEVDVEMSAAPIAVCGTDSLFRRIVFTTSAGNVRLYNCDFVGPAGLGNITGPITDSVVDSCRFFTGSGLDLTTVSGLSMTGCALINPLMFAAATSAANVRISNCSYSATATGPAAIISANNASNFIVSNCRFRSSQNGTTSGSRGSVVRFTGTGESLLVTGCVVGTNATSFVDGVVFDASSASMNACGVSDTHFVDVFASVLTLGSGSASRATVSNCRVRSATVGRSHYGVLSSGGTFHLNVSGCTFVLSGDTASGLPVAAVSVTAGALALVDLSVTGCSMDILGPSLTTYGVFVSGGTNVCRSLTVASCTAKFSSLPDAALVSFVTAQNTTSGSITGNAVTGVLAASTAIVALSNSTYMSIVGNTLQGATGSGVTGSVFSAVDCSRIEVQGNTLVSSASGDVASFSATTLGGSSNCSFSGNTVRGTGTAASGVAFFGTRFNNCVVSANKIEGANTSAMQFVSVYPSVVVGMLIDGNTLREVGTASASNWPLVVTPSTGGSELVITNNMVTAENGVARDPSRVLVSDVTRSTFSNNVVNFQSGSYVEFNNCDDLSVQSNNLFDGAGTLMLFASSNRVTFHGNILSAGGTIDLGGMATYRPPTTTAIQDHNIVSGVTP